ncbi:TPA: hypothetical protein ACH3X1_015613 [Trebouxia sp. C0004]
MSVQVCFESTGHAECSELVNMLSFRQSPTTSNRASNNAGTQFTSGIYYHTDKHCWQKQVPPSLFLSVDLGSAQTLASHHVDKKWHRETGCLKGLDSICKQQLQKEHCEEVGPSIGLLADKLQKQWHDRLNMHLGIILIRPASNRKATVLGKVRGKTGCPKCARAHAGRKADGTRQKHNTFAEAKHALLQQWDHDRHRENGLFPDNTTLRSGKLIWWKCHECPKGKVHSWQARPYSRTSRNMPTGCPCCAGHQLCECNSLETVCPDVAAGFHVGKMAPLLLKLQVQHAQSTAGCQMCLEPRSNLWVSARPTQRRSFHSCQALKKLQQTAIHSCKLMNGDL